MTKKTDNNEQETEPKSRRPIIKVSSQDRKNVNTPKRDTISKTKSSSNVKRDGEFSNNTNDLEIFDPTLIKRKLRFYFIITLAVGSIIILFPMVSGITNLVIASGLMAVYFLFGNKFARYPNTRAVFGDSMYYLGFLFTFVALVAAMMNISEETEVDTIIAQMGPALITTVIGMAVRIYLTQFDAITDEPETEAINSLGLLSANLIDALDALNKTSEQNRQAIVSIQERSAAQMESFVSRLSSIDTENITRRFQDLALAIESLTAISNDLKEKSERSKLTAGDIERSLNNLQASANKVSSQLEDVQNFDADLSVLGESLNKTTERFKTFSDRLEHRVGNSATEINNSVVALARDLSKTEEEIKTLAKTLKVSVSEVVEFLSRQK